MRNSRKIGVGSGFTLAELMIVVAIISATAVIVLPFAKRSNKGQKIREDCADIAQTIRYAMDLAGNERQKIRFIFNPKDNSYRLQQAYDGDNFKRLEGFTGKIRYIDKDIKLLSAEGFEQDANDYYIVFDPQRPWLNAGLSLATAELISTIKVEMPRVKVE